MKSILCLCCLVQQLSYWTVSSNSGMCVLPSPSASLGSFLRCLLSPSGFLLSLVSKVKVARSRRSWGFQFSWGGWLTVHLLAHCSPCVVLCDLVRFVLNFSMLFRPLAQLALSLVLGWFSACAVLGCACADFQCNKWTSHSKEKEAKQS